MPKTPTKVLSAEYLNAERFENMGPGQNRLESLTRTGGNTGDGYNQLIDTTYSLLGVEEQHGDKHELWGEGSACPRIVPNLTRV